MPQIDTSLFKTNSIMDYMNQQRSLDNANRASQAEAGLNDQKVAQAKAKRMLEVMSSISDQYTHDKGVQQLKSEGFDVSGLEGQPYDPRDVEMGKQQLMSAMGANKPLGGTNQLVSDYMASTGASFPEALQAVQSGFRQNMLYQNGALAPIPGAPEAKGELKYGETAGGKQAELQYEPKIAKEKGMQGEVGKQLGEATMNLNAAESAMPQLEQAVSDLSELGKKATYTYAGRARDFAVRQAGQGATEGAQARAEYIARVKNNVLPQLRRTFGAQFTKAEGDSLLATLGDPNSSPEEKDATLRAFIEDKKASIGTMGREIGRQKLTDKIGAESSPGKLIGTSGGKNVYELPDGSHVMEQ